MLTVKRITGAALFDALANDFFATAEAAIGSRGKCRVAVSGGNSPLNLFSYFAAHADNPIWKLVEFYWVDERFVPHKSSESNFGNAWRAGLSQIPATFFPIDTTLVGPEQSTAAYRAMLHERFNGFPVFDWMLLGAGTDGHTASVFKEHMAQDQRAFVWSTEHPVSGQPRISLSLDVCAAAKRNCVLLLGIDKAPILECIILSCDNTLPIVQVTAQSSDCVVYTDLLV